MILGKVIGNVVATVKHPVLAGHKLLIVQPEGADGKKAGKSIVAVDTVQAGMGDAVLVIDEGNSARSILENPSAPVRTVIAAIIDTVDF